MATTVLVIGYVWPEPNSSAAGRHMLSLLQLFRLQHWRVIFASPAQTTPHQIDLASHDIDTQAIALNCDSFDHFIRDLQPDIVLFDRFMMEEQFGWRIDKHCPDALKILDTEDLQCLRYARQQAVKQDREVNLQDFASDIAKREIAAIYRCDLSLIISPYEITLLQSQFHVSTDLLHHLPFLVDLPSLPPMHTDFQSRHHFISIGNFRHAPNWDAVLQLKRVWPHIRQQLPQVECHIYGAYPPPKATALHNVSSGFLIKGWADNAHDVMRQARVCLAPLRFGAGLKGKLLDAMEVGTPSVTTPIGSEGMHGDLAWPGQVTQSDEAFISAAIDIYQDEARWRQAQQQGRLILHQLYDGAYHGQQLINTLEQRLTQRDDYRLKNFTGAMLKHHTLASTQYMSQWIKAKNTLP